MDNSHTTSRFSSIYFISDKEFIEHFGNWCNPSHPKGQKEIVDRIEKSTQKYDPLLILRQQLIDFEMFFHLC